MQYEFKIGWRYIRSRAGSQGERNAFVSFISMASIIGIALGVAALIVVLSVMNGFQKEVRDRMLSVVSHIEILATSPNSPDWNAVMQSLGRHPRLVAAAPYALAQAMLSGGDQMRGAVIRGIDPALEGGVADAIRTLRLGQASDLQPGSFNMILGADLARALRVRPGDKVVVIAPQGNFTPAGVIPRLKQFTVSGIFESGHFEYDSALAMIHRDDALRLFRESAVTGLRLRVIDPLDAPQVAREVLAALPPVLADQLVARDWGQINRNWFAAVQVEKRIMFVILTLIIAVASFNLVSSLVMTVTDKRADIAILRTLGASPASIMKIFMVQGAIAGLGGTALGLVGGVLFASNVDAIYSALGLQLIPKGLYFIDYLPTDLRAGDVLSIGITAVVLAILATLYPSWRASRINPVESLRHE